MNQLFIPPHETFGQLRGIVNDGKFMFSLNDLCRILDYDDRNKAFADHCHEGQMFYYAGDSGTQPMNFVGIPAVMRLIENSPCIDFHTDRFTYWVFEVLIPGFVRAAVGKYVPSPSVKMLLENEKRAATDDDDIYSC